MLIDTVLNMLKIKVRLVKITFMNYKNPVQNVEIFTLTIRMFRANFAANNRPSPPAIINLIAKFEQMFSLKKEKNLTHFSDKTFNGRLASSYVHNPVNSRNETGRP